MVVSCFIEKNVTFFSVIYCWENIFSSATYCMSVNCCWPVLTLFIDLVGVFIGLWLIKKLFFIISGSLCNKLYCFLKQKMSLFQYVPIGRMVYFHLHLFHFNPLSYFLKNILCNSFIFQPNFLLILFNCRL